MNTDGMPSERSDDRRAVNLVVRTSMEAQATQAEVRSRNLDAEATPASVTLIACGTVSPQMFLPIPKSASTNSGLPGTTIFNIVGNTMTTENANGGNVTLIMCVARTLDKHDDPGDQQAYG